MFYNQRPFIYMGVGIVGLFLGKESKLALICGIVLLGCGAFVLFMRKAHQGQKEDLNVRHSHLTKEIQRKK